MHQNELKLQTIQMLLNDHINKSGLRYLFDSRLKYNAEFVDWCIEFTIQNVRYLVFETTGFYFRIVTIKAGAKIFEFHELEKSKLYDFVTDLLKKQHLYDKG